MNNYKAFLANNNVLVDNIFDYEAQSDTISSTATKSDQTDVTKTSNLNTSSLPFWNYGLLISFVIFLIINKNKRKF